MRRSTGLHANQAGWQRFEELRHLRPTKLFSDRDVLGRVNAVDLKYVLRHVQTDRVNLHVDGSPPCDSSQRTTLWHFDARSGRRPPHQPRSSRVRSQIVCSTPDTRHSKTKLRLRHERFTLTRLHYPQ